MVCDERCVVVRERAVLSFGIPNHSNRYPQVNHTVHRHSPHADEEDWNSHCSIVVGQRPIDVI